MDVGTDNESKQGRTQTVRRHMPLHSDPSIRKPGTLESRRLSFWGVE